MHYDPVSICSVQCPASYRLLDPLVIHLISLTRDPLDVLVLCVHLLTHRLTELVQAPSRTAERV
jgi:hypothetical protein